MEVEGKQGTTAGLTKEGYLLLKDEAGKVALILTGSVRPAHTIRKK